MPCKTRVRKYGIGRPKGITPDTVTMRHSLISGPTKSPFWRQCQIMMLPIFFILGGCATAPTALEEQGDRFEPMNRSIYRFNEGLDQAVLKPSSDAYVSHIPQAIQTGVSNFFANIQYLDTVLNDFLQGKPKQGFKDLLRVAVNTTLGLAGTIDVASHAGLKRHEEDFGQTLGVWNVAAGDYVVHPLLGSSTVRDTPGVVVSLLTNPIVYLNPAAAIPLSLLNIVDLRAQAEPFVRLRNEAALDPYLFTRDVYLQHRAALIHDGDPPPPDTLTDLRLVNE